MILLFRDSILSSTDKTRFAQYIKSQNASYRYILSYFMPVWEPEELEKFTKVFQYNNDWKKLYKWVGGVPRRLFNFQSIENFCEINKDDLDKIIKDKGGNIADLISSCRNFDMIEENKNNYTIIHLNPQKITTVVVQNGNKIFKYTYFYQKPLYSIETEYIERKIYKIIQVLLIQKNLKILIERIFLYLKSPTHGNKYNLPSLDNNSSNLLYIHLKKSINFEIEETDSIVFDEYIFYIPKSRIFESVYGFFASMITINGEK